MTVPEMAARAELDRGAAPRNALRESLSNRRFFWTVEFIPSVDKVLRDELHKLGGVADQIRDEDGIAGFSVTDRVVSDRDPDPVAAGAHLLDRSRKQPLVHFSGKGREIGDVYSFLDRMRNNGLTNMLVLTGDRLREEPKDRRPRYLESVVAIALAREAQSDLLLAAAVNPFKYREEDAMAQYIKLDKKIAAGADFVVTQIGYDMLKYEEALFWIDTRRHRIPIVANVMPMSATRARYIRKHQLAGVTVTDSYLALLEAEENNLPDRGAARAMRRLALQVLGLRHYGFAGVQLTGIHNPEKLTALETQIRELSDLCVDRPTWNRAWQESLTVMEGGRADPAPRDPWYLVNARGRRAYSGDTVRYVLMDKVHSYLFDRGPIAATLGALLKPVRRHGGVDRVLVKLERAIKSPLFGCEACGTCRLALTQYICPETCPKGLANGACGGTTENLCEFRDRECVHSRKYRVSRDMSLLDSESVVIAAVPPDARGTSSWPAYFRGERPVIAPRKATPTKR